METNERTNPTDRIALLVNAVVKIATPAPRDFVPSNDKRMTAE